MELMKPAEAAQMLRVRRSTLYAWIREGRIPAVRLSERVVRVPRERLEALLEDLSVGGQP